MMNTHLLRILLIVSAIFAAGAVSAQSGPPGSPPADWGPVSINLEEFEYPYPVSYMDFRVYNQDVRLAYMDVAPAGPANGRTVIFHHGGLYYGWYWEKQIAALSEAGYRVIAKDRLGWGEILQTGHSLQHQPVGFQHRASDGSSGHRTSSGRGPFHRRTDGDPIRLPVPGTRHARGDRQPGRPHRPAQGKRLSTAYR